MEEAEKVEPLQQKVINMQGAEVGSIELDPMVFGVRPNEGIVHQVVRWQLAARRSGTHSALKRGELKGSDRKPFRQKGTGRARMGSYNSPSRVGGGVAHGPTPRSYSFGVPKQVRRKAICAVLSGKVRDEKLLVLDSLEVASGKTKDLAEVLSKLEVGKRGALIILPMGTKMNDEQLLWRASRNLPRVTIVPVEGVNVYDLLRHGSCLLAQDAVAGLTARLLGLDLVDQAAA